jgi:mgtE-like transporter
MASWRWLGGRVFRQSSLALLFTVGGIVTGRLAFTFVPFLSVAPWFLTLLPPILTIRGSIGGILTGRIATMLQTGMVTPRLRGNTAQFYTLLRGIVDLTVFDTVGMGVISFALNLLLGRTSLTALPYFVILPTLTCVTAVALTIPVALIVAIRVFRAGLDPDIVVYPVMSTLNDVLVTLVYAGYVLLALRDVFLPFMEVATLFIVCLAFVVCYQNRSLEVFTRTLSEGIPVVFVASLLGSLNGVALTELRATIERNPAALILYPALITSLGNIGSILGSMATTKLALGYVTSTVESITKMGRELLAVEAGALLVHVLFGVAAAVIGAVSGVAVDPWSAVLLAVASNLMSFGVISLFSLLVATQTFQRGLDPDNFVIPLVTSLADTTATLSLMAVLTVLQL